MADDVDLAPDILADTIAAGVRAAAVTLAPGVAGDCENCGDHFARLVGGLCGFCRDGRRAIIDRPAPATDQDQEEPMRKPTPLPPAPAPDKVEVNLSFAPDSEALATIRRRACGGPLGPAARDLLQELIARPAEPAPIDAAPPTTALEDIHLDALLAEIARRFSIAGDHSAELAALARADEAEQRLERIKAAIG